MVWLVLAGLFAAVCGVAGYWVGSSRQPALAGSGIWTLKARQLPPPAGASGVLCTSIAKSPSPNTQRAKNKTITTADEWRKLAASKDSAAIPANEALARRLSVVITDAVIGGVPVHRLVPAKMNPEFSHCLFVYVHGGAFVVNHGRAALWEPILIARGLGIEVISVDYRMIPEFPYPAATDDVLAVWRELIKERPASGMVLGGTSAGGNIVLASVMRFKEQGLEMPGAIFAGTPWADLSKTGDSEFVNAGVDRQLVSYEGVLESAARAYADGRDLKNPAISPVYGDFDGFPPTILFTGTRDLFLSDTVRVHRKMRSKGVTADLHVFEGASHGEYMKLTNAPETLDFLKELKIFLRRHLSLQDPQNKR